MNNIELQKLELLRKKVIARFGLAAILILVILYAMAGTLNYWQGWLYWAVLVVPMAFAVSYLLKHEPELLERRMKYREKEKEQQAILKIGIVVFIAGFGSSRRTAMHLVPLRLLRVKR